MVSDPVDFDLAPLSDLAVTVRVKDPTDAVTGHPGARCTSYLQAGDAVADADLPRAARTPHWYYLCGVDVDASDAEAAAVAVLGDSITDGTGLADRRQRPLDRPPRPPPAREPRGPLASGS